MLGGLRTSTSFSQAAPMGLDASPAAFRLCVTRSMLGWKPLWLPPQDETIFDESSFSGQAVWL